MNQNITFQELIQKTHNIIDAFQKVEQRAWGIEGSMIELTKQVGELAKNIMVVEKYYLAKKNHEPGYQEASTQEIGNELGDILFMLIRIARHYNIDLQQVHIRELKLAEKYLNEEKTQSQS